MKTSRALFHAILMASASMASAAMTFVHPGARSGLHELEFVKAKIAAKAEPWTSHLNSAKMAGGDSRALGMALDWYYTGNVASANSAISALKRWNTRTPYEPPPDDGGNQSSLEAAWAASVLAPAAEIMSLYPGWSEADKADTKTMFRTVFLPALIKMSYWNGNVDLTQLDALLSTAVFLEDEAAFLNGIERLKKRLPAYFYLASDLRSVRTYANGTYNWSGVNAPVKWVDGITQETCRDNNHHAQFAIAAAIAAMETAWQQGVDLYTPHQERMVDAMELMALQLSSKDMQGTCASNKTTDQHGDDDRYNTLEIGYNHYHNRKGVAMPETWKEIQLELRTNGRQQFNMFHETLTHGDIVYSATGVGDNARQNRGERPRVSATADGSFVIQAGAATIHEVSIHSLQGRTGSRIALEMAPGSSRIVSPGAAWTPGIHVVSIRTSQGLETFKTVR
jgi:hypothetical protein